jgi:cytochrome c oxidase cbb3-type subunit 3
MKRLDKFNHKSIKLFAFFAMAFMSIVAQAQQQGAPPLEIKPEPSPYSDPLFWILASVALVLLIFISQLGKLFVAVIKNFARKGSDKAMLIVAMIAASMGISNSTMAQAADAAAASAPAEKVPFLHHGFGNMQLNILAIVIAVELIVVLYYAFLIKRFLVREKEAAPYVEKKSKPFWDRFNKSVAIEQEAAILTDHDYDGIKELDNNLPPWWKYGFYLTIVWAVVYLAHFHVFGTGALQLQELKNAEDKAAFDLAEYEKTQKNKVDEKTVVFMSSADDIAKGRAIFVEKNCAQCHGQLGEGKNGPNLTDKFWIHGGSINDIFKTIKYGVPEKGMRPWKSEINAPDMALLSSYIMSLQGSNPPGAVAPQGVEYIPAAAVADTTKVIVPDSLGTPMVDTLKVAGNK